MDGCGVITGIVQQGRRWVIYVDGRARLGLSKAGLERLGIRPGVPWTKELAEEAERRRSYETALRAAGRLVDRRMLSRAELEEKLRRRGWSEQLIGQVIGRLEELRMVEDRKLGELLIEALRKKGAVGQALLRAKLEARRLEPALVEELLRQAMAGRDVRGEAKELGRRRLARLRGLSWEVRRRRLTGFLMRRGFDAELVEEVVEELMGQGAAGD